MERPKNITDQQWQTAVDIYNSAKRQGDKYPELTVAQAALETGWFKKPSGKNNYFGQKATSKQAGTTLRTTEVAGNKAYKINDKFRDYNTIDEAVSDRIKKWGSKYQDANNVEEAISRIWKYDSKKGQGVGYATDPEYGNKVKSILGTLGTAGLSSESNQTQEAGYVGMLPNGLPDVYGQPYVAEEETKTETAEAPKRTDNANKLGFVADYEELSKQYEQQLQAQQKPILQQEIVEGVQYQPIQQNFQEGGYFFQKGGTWEKQQARMKAEKDAKLKALLAQEKPVYKKKTVDEKLAEKRAQENTKTVQKDNTNVRGYNNAEKFSKEARNKTDKEVAEERQSRIDAQAKANEQPFDWSNFRQSLADRNQATGDALRISNEPNFFDDYLNPATMIGSMADNLGQAPLRAEQTDSYMPYVTAIGTPLAVGAMAGYGTQNTGQFVNNLANPLAGTEDLVNLYRVQKVGQVPGMSQKVHIENKIKNGEPLTFIDKAYLKKFEDSPYLKGTHEGAGRWFTSDPSAIDYYKRDLEGSPMEVLKYTLPKKEAEKFNVSNFDNIAAASADIKTEFTLPDELIKKAERISMEDWLQGYKKVEVPIKQDGGQIPVSSRGVYDFPNQEVIVPTEDGEITMKNIKYPIIGTDEFGNRQLMQPDGEYKFPGKIIHEIPQTKRLKNKRFK